MAMGAVAVASTVVPQPGGSSGTQYSDVEAGGPPKQSPDLPSVPSPSGGSETPGDGGGAEDGAGGSVPPDSSQTPEQPQDPGNSPPPKPGGNGGGDNSQPSEPGGNGGGKGNGNGSSNGEGSGSGSGSGNSGGGSRPPSASSAAEADVLSLVNEEREEAGCRPVKAESKLTELAGDFSRSMGIQGFFSHIAPDGSGPWDRAEDAGILELGGENIARGQPDAEAVMDDWMDSPAHKANILNCEYRTLGVGAYLSGSDGPWWTQNFGF